MTWRKELSKELQYYLERIILESYSHKHAIEQAKDKGKAQLWIALAILQKKIADLELKTAYLERALKQFFPRKSISEKEKQAQEQEAEKILKNLLSGQKIECAKTKTSLKRKMKKAKKKSKIKIARSF